MEGFINSKQTLKTEMEITTNKRWDDTQKTKWNQLLEKKVSYLDDKQKTDKNENCIYLMDQE